VTEQAVQAGGRAAAAAQHALLGRRRELAQLRADVERAGLDTLSGRPSPNSRVLLVAGTPGSGRSTLAGEFVRQLAADYPGGVIRARLTAAGGEPVPTEQTVRTLLRALGAAAPPPGADDDELTQALRDELAGRRVLLLLDDVGRAEQVLDLLPDNRGCLLVAVAAGPLTGVPAVRPCAVGGLDRAASVALLARHAGSEVRLTVDPRRAEELAEACGDLPAALRLVGGWLATRPGLSVADAAARLADVPGPADERKPDHLARAFRLVHDSLPERSARLLRLLALAPAGWVDAHVAAALAGWAVPDAEAALADLARLGLLRTEAPGRHSVPGCLHPLMRAQLAERERPREVQSARARMLERLVRRLQGCHGVTEPPGSPGHARHRELPPALRFGDAAEAGRWLRACRPALTAAARMAVEADGDALDTLARRLVSALARALDVHCTPQEATPELYRLHELVLRVAERAGQPRDRAAALLNLADLDAGTGRFARALSRYRAALDAAREAADARATARALECLGGSYAELADWDRAADWYARALSARQADGDDRAAARLHGRLGAVHERAARWEDAQRAWRVCAALHRRTGDQAGGERARRELARISRRNLRNT
jgi:tetratricopeptide (TPR) repeat protein